MDTVFENIVQSEHVKSVVLAGKALLTLVSGKTGLHLTYKIEEWGNKKGFYGVYVFNGRDNTNFADYSYIGTIGVNYIFYHSTKSYYGIENKEVKVFAWLSRNWDNHDKLYKELLVLHHAKCCRCGRKLTNPSSIYAGIGSDCAKKMKI
jgi:hypothetical protein